jgi:hypothetical protein
LQTSHVEGYLAKQSNMDGCSGYLIFLNRSGGSRQTLVNAPPRPPLLLQEKDRHTKPSIEQRLL